MWKKRGYFVYPLTPYTYDTTVCVIMTLDQSKHDFDYEKEEK